MPCQLESAYSGVSMGALSCKFICVRSEEDRLMSVALTFET
jgi:hypothetical protein